jgi:hypothetical protein
VSPDPGSVSDTDADLGIIKWKLHEQLLQSEGAFHAAIEVKTWEGASRDFGTIEVHFVETHSNARRYYQHGKDLETNGFLFFWMTVIVIHCVH